MTASLSVCVIDANILLDLYLGGLLPELFHLPIRFLVPDVVLEELDEPSIAALAGYALESTSLDGPEVQQAIDLAQRNRRISLSDASALVLARSRQATLLTGDGPLRTLALQLAVPLHGTLWILDGLVQARHTAPSDAAAAIERMLAVGRRLPDEECRRRLARWRQRD